MSKKISEMSAITSAQTDDASDYLPVVDVSEPAAADKNKRILIEELVNLPKVLANDPSADNANITNLADGVNPQDAVNKRQLDEKEGALNPYNEETTSNYDFVLADANGVVDRNVATANTVTIPPNSSVAFELGTWLWVNQIDATTTWVAGSGVTITSSSGDLNCIGQLIPTGARKIGTNTWHLYNGKSATQIRSDIFAFNFIPKIAKGSTRNRFYGGGLTASTFTTQAQLADTIYAYPFIVSEELTLDTIQAYNTANVPNAVFRLGLYQDDGSCYPGSLVYGTAELNGAVTNTLRSETISPNITIDPGLYWFAVLTGTANAEFRAWNTTASPLVLGIDSAMTVNPPSKGLSVSQTYGAMPSSFPAGASPTASTLNAPMVLVRAV